MSEIDTENKHKDENQDPHTETYQGQTHQDEEDQDEVYEQYLNALHDYYTAQMSLSSNISSGFLHLARASFNSSRSYGQIWYDERMKAKALSKWHQGEGFTLIPADSESIDHDKNSKSDQTPEQKKETKQRRTRTQKDSINMFGAFPPESLKKSQSDFILALSDMVLVINKLHALESIESRINQVGST